MGANSSLSDVDQRPPASTRRSSSDSVINDAHPMSKTDILHLTASPCFGGVERQMLELGRSLQQSYRSAFATFQEEGRCWDFVERARQEDVEVHALQHDFPRVAATFRELLTLVRRLQPRLLCCNGYKSNFFGLLIARRMRIPIISVSHGWTGESRQVRMFEMLDRFLLRRMDRVVCVSAGQADKVQRAGVPKSKVQVIHCAVRPERFSDVDSAYRERLEEMFPNRPRFIVGAAGRLSPEKGFTHLIDAAQIVGREFPDAAFVLFGDGPLRDDLQRQIESSGMTHSFRLAGFCSDLDRYYPHLDLLVLPSYTEGLPNVVLEAFAAGVPVVATAVGGTPEVVQDGINGYLVAPGNAADLARRITAILADGAGRRQMGAAGQELVRDQFSFASQRRDYCQLLESLVVLPATPDKSPEARPVGTLSQL